MIGKETWLQVDHELTFNVNTQIKEQLKWLIGTGQIAPGDMLPAASQLADELGLNRNTINWVYNQLRDEGLVTMQKGRGTHVQDGPLLQQLVNERLPMHSLIEQVIETSRSANIDLQSFFMAGLAYTLLQEPQKSRRLRVLFIECQGHDHLFYRQAIEQATHGEVQVFFLEEAEGNEQLLAEAVNQNDLVITTLNHSEEVKALLAAQHCKPVVIGATVDTAALLEIAKLRQGSKVAFVCLGKSGGEWMARRIQDAGIRQIHCETIGWDESEGQLDRYRDLDKIYASAAVFPALHELMPDKVELFPMTLEKSSENLLHDLAGVSSKA